MIVHLDGGETVEIGATEVSPTITMLDFSRRETDDFGVTTVVRRGFSRRMAVRLALPTNDVDGLQRRLAALRATSALWVADDRFQWLSVVGLYKDFEITIPGAAVSFCTLSIEGLAETEVVADAGGDPAPEGRASTLLQLRPVAITDAILLTSSVPENDAAAWAAGTTYPIGARVVRAHRVFESLVSANVGNEPATNPAAWLDTGPTNRWAMFDQALGTTTDATNNITVTLPAGQINALALLDVKAAQVRVQAQRAQEPHYDRTIAIDGGAVTFLDLLGIPSGNPITITISGSGAIEVGTLLAGAIVTLGATEASPTASITDYSRKEVDEFGEVTIVPRAWAKKMGLRSLIDTAALDIVANRLADVRALPCLWIADEGHDALTVYGFVKDWSIEVGQIVSKVSLTVEGLSKAAKVEPLKVDWSNVTDKTGTRPENNATVGAPVGTPVAGRPAEEVVQQIDDLYETYGDSAAAAEFAQAAEVAKNAAETASANAAAARDQAGAARSAAEGARETAIQKAGEAGGFATTASNKSDEARGYSEAASASATVANTRAGQASTSASAAATSKDDAEGFSASASTSSEAAAGSATAARSTAARLYPSDFARAGEFFTQLAGDPDAAPGVTAYPVYSIVSDAAGKLLRLTNPGIYQQTRTRALIPNQAGRRWRIEARVRVFQNGMRPILFALNPYGLQSDFTTIVYSGHAVTHLTAFGPGMVAADGWRTIYLEFTCGGGVCPWIAPSIYVYSNIPGVGDATPSPCIVEYQYLRVADITEPYAASTSASSASASKDGAVEAASAAEEHSNTASTRASEARTYRDEAATSASNAGGSAATASQQAGLAAGSASAAGGSASAAQSSASVASTKADQAGASATVASTAKQEAISARDAAQSSAGNASGSAGVASGHAAAALEYRNTTATYRDQAAGSASSASLSAQSASQSAAQVDADVGAISQRVDSVEATANGASASASQSAAAIAGINGQLASRLVLESVAGNNRAQVKLYASANGGAGVDIIGDTTFRGKVILDNGSIMIAMGIGFGTNNQFLEWVGPSRDLSQCNEASALRYVRKDGQAYFKGAFLAGDLRAGQQNPSLAANVTADTGLIGSNGGEIQAVASWTYSRQTVVNYPGTTQGRNNFIAAAQAAGAVDDGTGYWSSSASVGIGDNVLTVAKEGVTQASSTINTGVRNFFGYEPVPADQAPGSSTTTITAGGSVTFSDPERATRTRSFQATLSRSGNLAGPSSQRVGIATAE